MTATVAQMIDHDPASDAGRRGVEQMLLDALADLRNGAVPSCGRAVLILGWINEGTVMVRPYAAGVDLISAVGLLDLGQMELYTGGEGGL